MAGPETSLPDDACYSILRWLRNAQVWHCAAVSRQWLRVAKRVILERKATLFVDRISLRRISSYNWCPNLFLDDMPINAAMFADWPVRCLDFRARPGDCAFLPNTVEEVFVRGDILGAELYTLLERTKSIHLSGVLRNDGTSRILAPTLPQLVEYEGLSQCYLDSAVCRAATNLQRLFLKSIYGTILLPTSLRKLYFNKIDDVRTLRALTNLRVLRIYDRLESTNRQAIWEVLSALTNLESLRVLGGSTEGAVTLPKLAKLETDNYGLRLVTPALRKLRLEDKIHSEFVTGFPPGLRELKLRSTTHWHLETLTLTRFTRLHSLCLFNVSVQSLVCAPLRYLKLDDAMIYSGIPPATIVKISIDQDEMQIIPMAGITWRAAPRTLVILDGFIGKIPEGVERLFYRFSPEREWDAPLSCRFLEAEEAPHNLTALTHLEHCHLDEGVAPPGACPSKRCCQLEWDD